MMISAWENGRQVPDATYRRLLQYVFDLPAAALGFPADYLGHVDEGLAPLVRAEIWDCLGRLKAEGLSLIVIDKNIGALLEAGGLSYGHVVRTTVCDGSRRR